MGERGLYSRIVAPFRGSALAFVAGGKIAAPAQLTLDVALEIYGPERARLGAERTFAVVGNPAGHSRSPSVHNSLFRQKGVRAAYTIASVERFEEVEDAIRSGELTGVSVTAPFKLQAFAFARSAGAHIAENAAQCGAVNTVVGTPGGLLADNTDVDGFSALLAAVCGRDRKSVAIVGAGGTARAARLAVERLGMHVTIFNRTEGKLGALPLRELRRWDGEVIVDTVSADVELPFRPGMTYIRASYSGDSGVLDRARAAGVTVYDGLDLLHAQAGRQNELFMKAFNGS
jgi:shikimate 5-dehydrogenase